MGLFGMKKEINYLVKENIKLRKLCRQKDNVFKELMADGLRHGSKLAAQHMSERKKYLNGK